MADFSAAQPQVTPLFISTISMFGVGFEWRAISGQAGPASRTWVANLAAYIPISIPFAYQVRRVWWLNGSTASSNVDMGIFSGSGVQLFSTGSTAQSGASVIQYVAADILLTPGTYYLAWANSGTTNRANTQTGSAIQGRTAGLLQQATALPLPATMTGASWAQAFGPPYCGVTRTASGF